MPRTFTDENVNEELEWRKLDTGGSIEDKRERLAAHVEAEYQDYVEAWEIRTGKPWNQMTAAEARALIAKNPDCARNPGVLSRLMS